jgi:hypothetical protein
MGTSSITVFRDDIAGYRRGAFYRQFDSYLEGHGFELAYFLCFPAYAKTQVDLASAFIRVYGGDEVDYLTPLPFPVELEDVIANREPFLEDFLYIADAGDNPYIRVYGSFGNEKPSQQIFEGTPQQLIRKLGRAEDIPDGRIDA